MTELEAQKFMAALMAAYPVQTIKQETIQVYTRMLMDLDHAAVQQAIPELISRCKFFPTIAEITEAAKSHATGLPEPAAAWAEVERAMLKSGYYSRPSWSHPAIHATIRALGGWQEVCRSEDVDKVKRRFTSQYASLRDSWNPNDAPALPEPERPKSLDELQRIREERWAMLREARDAASE